MGKSDLVGTHIAAFIAGFFGLGALILASGSDPTSMRQKCAIDAARGTMRFEAKLVEQPDGTTKWVVTERVKP
jgi:hypothetical protein